MLKFSANLSFLYPEYEFIDRFKAAADDGFRGVEFTFPYAYAIDELARALRDNGLQLVLFNCPPGAGGERGIAILHGREAELRAGLERAIDYAHALDCPRLHLMSGVAEDGAARHTMEQVLLQNLRDAAQRAGRAGVTLTLEPINELDIPGYYLQTQAQAASLIEAVGSPHLGLQMDLYHCQIVEGDVTRRLRRYFSLVKHIQIAGVPDRREPDTSELDFEFVFGVLQDLGYDEWIGCEYRPRAGTRDGLRWLANWR